MVINLAVVPTDDLRAELKRRLYRMNEERREIEQSLKDNEGYEDFGKAIRELRKRFKLTQKDLARLLGMKQPAICMAELGQRPASGRKILKDAQKMLGVRDAGEREVPAKGGSEVCGGGEPVSELPAGVSGAEQMAPAVQTVP